MTARAGGGGEGPWISGMAGQGELRWSAVDCTGAVEEARERLDLSPLAAAALGRMLAASALLLRMAVKTPVRLTVDVHGDGPLGRLLAEADHAGNLRGLVGDPRASLPPRADGKLDVGSGVGGGTLQVVREGRGGGFYHSRVRLVTGEIGDDVAHFLDQSEQTRSAVLLGVLTRRRGVAAAGGILVEALPGTGDATLSRLEANLLGLPGPSRQLETLGVDGLVETCLEGLAPRITERRRVRYRCTCSIERIAAQLETLAAAEPLDELRNDRGGFDIRCLFCGRSYALGDQDLPPGG